MSRVLAVLGVVPVALLAWVAKILGLWGADAPEDAVFWGSFAASVVVAASAVSWLFRRARMKGAALTAYAFTAFYGAPFFLDIHAAVASEVPERATAYAILGFALGVVLLGSWRALALKGLVAVNARGFLLRYLVVSLSETALLGWAPLLHFSSVPVPLPPARAWREGRASEVPLEAKATTSLVVLVDPDSSEERRAALSKWAATDASGFAAHVARLVGHEIDARGGGGSWGRIVLVFPETSLAIEPAAFRALWPALAEAFAGRAGVGAPAVEVALGARFGEGNVLYRGFLDDRLGQARGGVAASKASFVPFFEVPFLGVSVRRDDVSRALGAADDERLGGGVASGSGLEFGGASLPALVCYEALAPWRWPVGGRALVLTNHRPFAVPGTASRTYDLLLRQIARATGTAVLLAANRGTSGVFGEGVAAQGDHAVDGGRVAWISVRPARGL